MDDWKRFAAAFAAVVLVLGGSAVFGAIRMRQISAAMVRSSHQYLAATRMSTAFEREILTARIFFIYHVTIQIGAVN